MQQWSAQINTCHTFSVIAEHTVLTQINYTDPEVYKISLTDPRPGLLSPYFVPRRYSEFSELFKVLSVWMKEDLSVSFPQKSFLAPVAAVLEQRRISFERLCNYCLSDPSIRSHPFVGYAL